MVRASHCESEGRGFDPRLSIQLQLEKNIQHYWKLFDRSINPSNPFKNIDPKWQTALRWDILMKVYRLELELEEVKSFGAFTIRRKQLREQRADKDLNL